jgi:hypothetical protein
MLGAEQSRGAIPGPKAHDRNPLHRGPYDSIAEKMPPLGIGC